MGENIINNIESIRIGESDSVYFTWTGIDTIRYEEGSTWVHVDIPKGPMLHQSLKSPLVTGEVRCLDWTALNTALFTTDIDEHDHHAIGTQPLKKKFKVAYFRVNARDEAGNAVYLTITGFRVNFITLEAINEKETMIVVHFLADYVELS